MIDTRKIGAYISRLRKGKNWTQMQLADQVNVTHQAVSRWERGDSLPDVGLLSDLAAVFDVSVDELLKGEPSRPAARFGQQPGSAPAAQPLGIVVRALAEGRPEEVARMVKERQVAVGDLIQGNQLTALAPHLSQAALGGLMEKVMNGTLDRKILTVIAPFVDSRVLNEMVRTRMKGA